MEETAKAEKKKEEPPKSEVPGGAGRILLGERRALGSNRGRWTGGVACRQCGLEGGRLRGERLASLGPPDHSAPFSTSRPSQEADSNGLDVHPPPLGVTRRKLEVWRRAKRGPLFPLVAPVVCGSAAAEGHRSLGGPLRPAVLSGSGNRCCPLPL